MFGGIWTFDSFTLTVDGKEVRGPGFANPWIEFRDDGTVAGDYGCTPFRAKAKLEANTLTLGEALPMPSPSATPAPSDTEESCQTPEQQQQEIARYKGLKELEKEKSEYYAERNEKLADFEAKVKKFLHRGQLKITEKKLERESGGPPPGTLPQLRNEHGDVATLDVVRSTDFFDTPFQLTMFTFYDHPEDFGSAKDTSFAFHRDGTVTGKLVCNDFTARVYFNGSHLFFRDAELTTHRTCAAQKMKDEADLLKMLRQSLNYRYTGTGGGMYMREDGDEHWTLGITFRTAKDQ
ncbi:META domain-containing protein [Streptomyces sp. NPDC093097]|uniref:META domain-containing protein n=1 Tax=Streptomyces sp. NPDC093097 TaxID=3366027 RepID=UPI0037F6EB2C